MFLTQMTFGSNAILFVLFFFIGKMFMVIIGGFTYYNKSSVFVEAGEKLFISISFVLSDIYEGDPLILVSDLCDCSAGVPCSV